MKVPGRRILAICLVLPALAACEGTVGGNSTPQIDAVEVDLYDSCTLPADVVAAAGLDPNRVDNNPFGVPRTGWRGCAWTVKDFAVRVFATTRTVDEYRNNPSLHDFRDVDLEGRQAFSFLQGKAQPPDNCSVAFGTSRGTIDIYLTKDVTLDSVEDWCARTLTIARLFNSHIPK